MKQAQIRLPISPVAGPGERQRWYTELPCDRLRTVSSGPSFP